MRLVALLLAVFAPAATPTLVLGNSIGGVGLGQSQAAVVAAFGRVPLAHQSYGGKPFDLAVYTPRGGALQVFYDRATKKVVGVSTTSARYRTGDGFGVGSPASAAKSHGFQWNAQCTTTYLKSANGIHYELFTRGHSRIGPISQVFFIRAPYAGDC